MHVISFYLVNVQKRKPIEHYNLNGRIQENGSAYLAIFDSVDKFILVSDLHLAFFHT